MKKINKMENKNETSKLLNEIKCVLSPNGDSHNLEHKEIECKPNETKLEKPNTETPKLKKQKLDTFKISYDYGLSKKNEPIKNVTCYSDTDKLNDALLDCYAKSRVRGECEVNLIGNIDQDAPYLGFYYCPAMTSRIVLNFNNGRVFICNYDKVVRSEMKDRINSIIEIMICGINYNQNDLFEMIMKMKNLKSLLFYSRICDRFTSDMWDLILEKGITKTGYLFNGIKTDILKLISKHKKVNTLLIDHASLEHLNKFWKKNGIPASLKNAIIVRHYFNSDGSFDKSMYKCEGEVEKLNIIFHNIYQNTISYIQPTPMDYEIKDGREYYTTENMKGNRK